MRENGEWIHQMRERARRSIGLRTLQGCRCKEGLGADLAFFRLKSPPPGSVLTFLRLRSPSLPGSDLTFLRPQPPKKCRFDPGAPAISAAQRSRNQNEKPIKPQRRDERRKERASENLCAHRVSAVSFAGRKLAQAATISGDADQKDPYR